MTGTELWPPLPLREWRDTLRTLHMWTQIVGKVRMELSPPLNHWWHVPLYVNSRGLTTGPVPYPPGLFEIQFDFQKHELSITTSEGVNAARPLRAESVASFYGAVLGALRPLGITVEIDRKPQEVANPVPFDEDHANGSYDADYAHRFWRVLVSSAKVFERFRSRFMGKCSPVHFFWGGFDLAVSRFSGRLAPPREGADIIQREGYSHEVSSVGWWPGDPRFPHAAFYSYIAPEPAGFKTARVLPHTAKYDTALGEFLMSYEDARREQSPEKAVLDFAQTTYDAAANLAKWDRASLER